MSHKNRPGPLDKQKQLYILIIDILIFLLLALIQYVFIRVGLMENIIYLYSFLILDILFIVLNILILINTKA